MRRSSILLLLGLLTACAPVTRPVTPIDPTLLAAWADTCRALWTEELGRPIDPPALADCVAQHRPAEEQRALLHASPEWAAHQAALVAAAAAARLPFAGEHGWLRVDGKRLVTDDGTTWRGRGFSDFRLLERFVLGEDIAPVLTERIRLGANYLRVFLMYNGGIGHLAPVTSLARLSDFLSRLEARGLRAEIVVFADAQTIPIDQHEYLGAVAKILRQHWNALGELVNEAPQNGVNPIAFDKPSGPTLWSRGSNLGDQPPFAGWDYLTSHPDRNDEWPRKVPCREYLDPCFEDEPIGASATDQPGRRSANADDFGYFGGICGEWAQGCLFHSDSGIQSVVLGPVERAAAVAFFAGLAFSPVDASFWPYQRGDNCGRCQAVGDMPLAQWDLPHPQGTLRTVCRGDGTTEYCVAVRPTATWVPQPLGPWRIVERTGPRGAFVRLAR